jgi:hypothetical protein
MVSVFAEGPLSDIGDAAAKPKPDPSAVSTNETAIAAAVPPKIAGQEIAETRESAVPPLFVRAPVSYLLMFAIDQCQSRARSIMIGIGIPSIQSRIPRPTASSIELSK